MVKNTKGGKGSKGLARKLVNAYSESNTKKNIRKPENKYEVFALTTKMYGTMCEVLTNDGKSYKCHIRGKFRGRSKRNSIVSIGKILLVGFREFEEPNFKVCDLLEIYEPNEVNELQKMPDIDIRNLIIVDGSNSNEVDDILFTNDEYNNDDLVRVNTILDNTDTIQTDDGDIISFDDI
jgi:translation initiation factor IF-1